MDSRPNPSVVSDDPLVIVGAGHAGGRAAETLRLHGCGKKIILVGSEEQIPYERPELSKGVLAEKVSLREITLRPPEFYQEVDVDLRLGVRVERIDRQAQRISLSNGSTLPYSQVLLATGARPRSLAVHGIVEGDAFYLRTYEDAVRLRARLTPGKRIAVIGGGVIGLEVAATARQRGSDVVVIEPGPHLMARMITSDLAEYLAKMHARAGVEIFTGVGVAGLERAAGKVRVALTDGQCVTVDSVFVGIGAVPNTELATEAGLAVTDGVVVDEFGRTSDPTIYAAGDVTRHPNPALGTTVRLETWLNAQNQAIATAQNMLGTQRPYSEVPWAWTTQYDVNVQVAGFIQRVGQRLRLEGAGPNQFAYALVYGDRVTGAISVNMPREMRHLRKLIAMGASIDMLDGHWRSLEKAER